jgi:hypothetical protein
VVDQFVSVVELDDLNARRQALFDLFEFGGHPAGHVVAVFAHQHEAQTENDFALPVGGDGAAADVVADDHLRDLVQENGRASLGVDDDLLQVLDSGGGAYAADADSLAAIAEDAAADIEIAAAQGVFDLLQGDVVLEDFFGIDTHLILLLEAAPRIDFGGAGHGAHDRPDRPVVDPAQVHQVEVLVADLGSGCTAAQQGDRAGEFLRAAGKNDRRRLVGARHGIVQDLAQARGDRPHFRLHARRQVDRPQTLVDEIARRQDFRTVVESDDDLRQPELRSRANLRQVRQAADRLLNGKRDLPFDFLGG